MLATSLLANIPPAASIVRSCRILIIKDAAGALNLPQYVLGLGRRIKGFGCSLWRPMHSSIALLRRKTPWRKPFSRQVAKELLPIFSQEQWWGEVHMETWMAMEPPLHLLMFVRRVVVQDHVELFAGRNHVIDGPKKLQLLLMAALLVVHRICEAP
jgi:hypothetical protein